MIRRLLRHALVLGFAVAVAAPGVVWAQEEPGNGKPAMRVGTDRVRLEPLQQKVPVIGRFVAPQAGVVAASIGGLVGAFRVDVGDRVEKGDVVAVLVKDRLQWQHNLQRAEVAYFSAQLETKQAESELKRQELERLDSLRKSPAFSQARRDDKRQELSVADSETAEAQARLKQAEAEMRLSAIDLYNADVRAPYSGVVSKRHTAVGSYLRIGDPVVTLIDDETLEIEAAVPASRIAGLTPGTGVTALIDSSHRIEATVRAVVPDENPQTRTRTVRFVPKSRNGATNLAANQSITLYLPVGVTRDVLTVHKDAVLNRKGKNLVFVVEDDAVERRVVVLGEATGSRFIVEQGLAEGDVTVVRGNERLRPGQKVSAQESGEG